MADASRPPDPKAASGGATGSLRPLVCDVCGAPAVERHCKIVCGRCGYTRDCSDP